MSRMIKLFCVIILLVNLCGCSLSENENRTSLIINEDQGPVYHEDGTITLSEGYVANGFIEKESGNRIDNLAKYEVLGNKIEGKVDFQQNLKGEYNYILITMLDYKQHKFFVEGKEYMSYPFSVSNDNEMVIDISLLLENESASEFSYIIIQEPNEQSFMKYKEFNWDIMFACRNPLIYRINLTYDGKRKASYLDEFYGCSTFIANGEVKGFELCNNHEDLIPVVEGKSGETVELTILNQNKEAIDETVKIVTFLGWKQVSAEQEKSSLIKISKNESLFIPFELPKVKERTVLQIFAFVNPYQELSGTDSEINYSTFRVIVNP